MMFRNFGGYLNLKDSFSHYWCVFLFELTYFQMTAFEEFGVLPEIGKAVDEMSWSLPTDVQSEAIPLILGGGDVLMAAETGSGKTGAFCLPILQITWESLKELQEGGKGKSKEGGVLKILCRIEKICLFLYRILFHFKSRKKLKFYVIDYQASCL